MAKMEKEWEVTTERFVAFFDIMGFKDRVISSKHKDVYDSLLEIKKLLDSVEKSSFITRDEKTKAKNKVKTTIFSDSILIFTEDSSKESLLSFLMAIFIITVDSFRNQIPIKGAVSHGLVSVDLTNNIFFGQPIIDAYLLEEDLMFYGVVADSNFNKIFNTDLSLGMKTAFKKYKTPFKFGYSNHLILDWAIAIEKYYAEKKMEIDIKKYLDDLYYKMHGKPRIYLDNTIEYFKANYVPKVDLEKK